MAGVPASTSAAGAAPRIALLASFLGVAAVLYLPLVGHRWDYLGHFATGAGLALALTVVARLAGAGSTPAAVGSAAGVVGLSVLGEALRFSHLFFDWADIGAGALGAALVAAWALGEEDRRLRAGPLLALSVLLVMAGIGLRFGIEA